AAVLVRAHDLDARIRLHGVEEALLALSGAVMALGVAQQHDLALAAERLREPLAAHAAALEVVGRDEAAVVVALQSRVEDDDRNLLLLRLLHGAHERRFVERREADAGHAAAHGVLDLRHLRVAIVLAQRPAPDDGHAELRAALLGAGADALPEHV